MGLMQAKKFFEILANKKYLPNMYGGHVFKGDLLGETFEWRLHLSDVIYWQWPSELHIDGSFQYFHSFTNQFEKLLLDQIIWKEI